MRHPVILRVLAALWAACAMATAADLVSAEAFPSRPVRIIVPLSQGSASDTLTRIVAQKLSEMWGVGVVVENQPGANGVPATANALRAPPDGYTLFAIQAGHVINASMYSKLPYDTLRDVRPIVRIGFTPLILVVKPSVSANSLKELLALAKTSPGKLNFGSSGSGSAAHLAAEMLKSMAGISMTHIPYKGVNQAQMDLLGGQIDLMFVVPSFAIPEINSGRLRALGVASIKRMPQLPQLPTIAESGVPGFEALPWIGLAGPAKLPDDIVQKIWTDTAKVLATPDVQALITNAGLVVDTLSPAEFPAYVANEQSKMAKVVKDSGAHAD